MSKFEYWQEEVIYEIYESKLKEIEKKIDKEYHVTGKEITMLIKDLWVKMLEDGTISADTVYKNNRYSDIQKLIWKELKKLGDIEYEHLEELLYSTYVETYEKTHKVNKSDPKKALKIINSIYFGYTYSNRIYINKDKVRDLLYKNILNGSIGGTGVNEVLNQVERALTVALGSSAKLYETEIMRVANAAQMQAYIDQGYKNYKIVATIDKATCRYCELMDYQEFNFKNAVIGFNYPPFHPHCRCSAVPIK